MRAELALFGMRFNMSRRARRRALVTLIYAAFAALMAASWFLDHWRMSGTYFLMNFALLVSWVVLGGYYPGGLLRPFDGYVRRRNVSPPSTALELNGGPTAPAVRESLTDERELRERDRAHYQAFRWFAVAFLFLSLLANPHLVGWLHLTADHILDLLHGGLLVGLMLGLTLPQAILLWTEPDMETEA
jgi:hypothetical protein